MNNEITVHILVGLPGCGKTSFANKLQKDGYAIILDFDSNFTHDYISKTIKRYYNYDAGNIFAIDGLFLSKKHIYELIDVYKSLDNFKFPYKYNFILHVWKIDRDACLYNDEKRNRELKATNTIKSANIDAPTVKELEDRYCTKNNYVTFKIVEHETKKMNIIQEFIEDNWYNIEDDKILKSDEWSLGGTWGNCWGDHGTVSAEKQLDFAEFDNFINVIAPNIPFLKYKRLFDATANIVENEHYDYYGGSSKDAHWEANIEEIIGFLKENDLLEVEI